MTGPGRDKDLVADLLVYVAAALAMAIALLPRIAEEQAPVSIRPDPALVHEIELNAISLAASERLPAEVQSQIGLTGEPLATRKGVLEDLGQRLRALPPSPDLELVRLSLATAWREDDLVIRALHAFDGDIKPKTDTPADTEAYKHLLERTKPVRDALANLANGRPAHDIAALEGYLQGVGASRWLVGLVKARHLANANDPAHTALDTAMGDIAQDVALRHALFFALGIGLIVLGSLLFIIFPGFIRPRLIAKGIARELLASPFLLERTRRVVLGWFAGAYLVGYIVSIMAASLGAPGFAQPLAGLCSGLVAVLLIRHWGLAPTFPMSLAKALTLSRPEGVPPLGPARRVFAIVFGTVAALAIAVAVTWFFETLNYMLVGPPETQQSIKQLMANGDTLALILLGLSAVVIAPVVEEIVFRGFLFRNLRDTIGKGLAAVLSGLVFGLVHMHPTLIIPLTGLGIALALLYEWTGSLWVPILAHMAFNLLTLVRIEAIWRI